jgi:hypothetical protein
LRAFDQIFDGLADVVIQNAVSTFSHAQVMGFGQNLGMRKANGRLEFVAGEFDTLT